MQQTGGEVVKVSLPLHLSRIIPLTQAELSV